MIKVGLIGEDYNDTLSLKNLLSKRFTKVVFKPLFKGVRGCNLDSGKLERALNEEFKRNAYSFLIYIRDLDGFSSDQAKKNIAKNWFMKLDNQFGKNGLFLLNVWELEALILADIGTFNSIYKASYKFSGTPTNVEDPKGELKRHTRKMPNKFHESHCPSVFDKLDIDTVEQNCDYFRTFLAELKAAV